MCVQHPTVKSNANHKSSQITNNHQTSPQIAQMVLITWLHSSGRETGYVVCSERVPRVGILLGYPFGYPFEHCPCPTFVTAAEDRTGRRASMTPVRKASKRNTCVMYGRWAQRIPGPMYMRLNLENTKYHNVLLCYISFFSSCYLLRNLQTEEAKNECPDSNSLKFWSVLFLCRKRQLFRTVQCCMYICTEHVSW